MGRRAKHGVDDFLDSAVELFAANGIRAVTLAAVAERLGAANGSVYYRFPDRETLLQAMWLRTSERFRRSYAQQMGDEPEIDDAIEAAVWVADWCRSNQAQAQVLQAGPRAFGPDGWPAQRAEADQASAQLRGIVELLANHTQATPDEIAFVLVELPLAVVRRHLQAGRTPRAREMTLIRGLAAAILDRDGGSSGPS